MVLLELKGCSVLISSCHGASCQVVLGHFISCREVQGCSCLVAMLVGYSLVLAWVFTLDMVEVNSVVVVGSIPSSCGVQAPLLLWCEGISLSSRGVPLYW